MTTYKMSIHLNSNSYTKINGISEDAKDKIIRNFRSKKPLYMSSNSKEYIYNSDNIAFLEFLVDEE